MLTKKVHTMDLPVTMEQINRWQLDGVLIQDAFPNLNADEREFLKTGITKEEWAAAFPEEE
jgi:hypothetical protein